MIARLPGYVVWGAAALAAISVGLAAGPVVWHVAGDAGLPRAVPDQQADLPPEAAPDLAPILGFAPFGSTAAPVEAAPEVAGETSLGLVLLGVTVAVPDSASRAIIGGGDEPVASFSVGAQVTAEAVLAEVHPGYVVLDVAGQLERLSFAAAGTSPGGADGSQDTEDGPDLRNMVPESPSDGSGAAGTPGDPSAVIADYQTQVEQDPQGVLDRLGLVPTDEGYRVAETAAPGVLQAGFQVGDVVTSVNGQKVGDMLVDQVYFNEVAASGRARVEIQRDGQMIVMTFPLQ